MSLFLGKIHYWLYNKIKLYQAIEEEIIESVGANDTDTENLVKHINQEFGAPTGNRDLEEIIDTSNIHGWLQERIQSAELRQAALITQLLQWKSSYKDEILKIYEKQGEEAAKGYENTVYTPEEMFNVLNDCILEGMPCDRVNRIIDSNDDEFSWQTTMCLHKPYWDRVGGNIQNFYDFREAWVKAFVQTMNSDFKYEKAENGLNRIIRQ